MRVKYKSNFYEFDTDRFLYHLSTGEAFYTTYHEVTVKNQNGKTCWYQSLSYQIDENFIKNNFKKFEILNILSLLKE